MPYPLYSDVSAAVRALLDDQGVAGGAIYTDSFLEKYVQMAQNTLVGVLAANGVCEMQFRQDALSIPAGTTDVYRPSETPDPAPNPLPPMLDETLIVPLFLAEAKVGGTNQDYVPMQGPLEIPAVPQTDTLGYWDWLHNHLKLLGATVDRLLRIDFLGDLAAVSSATPSVAILITNAGNSLASLAAGMAARARGQHAAADRFVVFSPDQPNGIGGQAGTEITNLVSTQLKAQQAEPQRRRPYFGRDRYSTADFAIRGRY